MLFNQDFYMVLGVAFPCVDLKKKGPRGEWYQDSIDYMLNNYMRISASEMALILGRSEMSVRKKLNEMGINYGEKQETSESV